MSDLSSASEDETTMEEGGGESSQEQQQKKKKFCKSCCKKPSFVVRAIVTTSLLVIWLAVGAVVFSLIEHPAEEERLHQLNAQSDNRTNTTSPFDFSNMTDADIIREMFEKYVTEYEIVNLANNTIVVSPVGSDDGSTAEDHPNKWDYSGSLFFSVTIVTTIGYGNFSPSTDLGKIVCVIFATIGIPLMMLVVSHMTSLLVYLSGRLARVVAKCKTSMRSDDNRQRASVNQRRHQRKNSALYALLISIFGVVLFLLLPSILIWQMEDWDYLTALYYCYITLSTIGFGDNVAGQSTYEYHRLYRFFLSVWIFFGMSFIGMAVSNLQALIASKTKKSVNTISTRLSQTRNSLSTPQEYYAKFSRRLSAAASPLARRRSTGALQPSRLTIIAEDDEEKENDEKVIGDDSDVDLADRSHVETVPEYGEWQETPPSSRSRSDAGEWMSEPL